MKSFLKIFILFFVFFVPASLCFAAVSFDSSGSGFISSGASITWSHTVGSGSNRLLVVGVSYDGRNGATVSGVTYGGVALTFIRQDLNPARNRYISELWYLTAPNTGTANVVVTLSASIAKPGAGGSASFSGVDQTTSVSNNNGGWSVTGNPSVVITSSVGDMVIDNIADYKGTTLTVGAGQTQRWNTGVSGTEIGAGSTEAGASSVTMSWTGNVGDDGWAASATNINAIVLDTTPPSAVSNLATSGATATTLDLDWTAPGDDAGTGTATTYDIRYSTSNITNDTDFNNATQVTGEPTPSVASTAESMTVTGLSPSTTYYFAIKTSDEVPNTSAISNIPTGTTIAVADTTPPAAVSNLATTGATATTMGLTWTAPGDDGSTGTATTYDIRYSTSLINEGNWASATQVTGEPTPSVAGTSEFMVVSGLSSGTTYYFAIKTSDEVPNTSTISNIPTGTTIAAADTTPPANVSNLAISNVATSTLILSWTSPGDDGSTGTATTYDIRYSTSNIANDTDFNNATQVTGEPTPSVAGSSETINIVGLSPSSTYYFAIKTSDEVPNISGLSNVPSATTDALPDTTTPSAISDLGASNPSQTTFDLAWTAPGDDGSTGTATTYDIRYSTSLINEGNWASATQVTGEPTPSVAGTSEFMVVSGLSSGTTYYFAIKTSDEVPNTSAISNIPTGTTTVTPDTTPPSIINNLLALSPGQTTMNLTWTAPGDDGSTGTATTYDIRYSTSLINEGNWASATQVTGEPTPSIAGTSQSMTVTGLSQSTTYYFAIKTSDEVPNTSAISNVPSATTTTTPDTTSPSAVSNLSSSGATQTTVGLIWTSPGDDGSTGTATTYDIRYSTSNIANDTDFNNATQVTGEPTPSIAGTSQSMTVTGLSTGVTYYFAIKTSDEASNTSDLSNTVIQSTEESSLSIPTTSGGGVSGATRVSFAGLAFPGSQIKVLIKDDINPDFKNVPISIYEMSKEGVFSIDYLAFLTGKYFIGLKGIDKTGQETGILSFNVDFRNQTSLDVRDIFFPPTVIFSEDVVGLGKTFKIFGYSSLGSEIELKIDDVLKGKTNSDDLGYYSFEFNSGDFSKGTHYVRVRQSVEDKFSSYSFPRTIKFSNLNTPKADFNNDGKINVTDWSVFLFRWGSKDFSLRSRIDLDNNGKIDIVDFSIFLKAIKI